MMLRRATCLWFGLCLLPAAALAQEKDAHRAKAATGPAEMTDPLEILRRVDAACKAVSAVKYDVVYQGRGKLEGTVILSGYAQGLPEKFFIDVKYQGPEETEPRRITGGSDNETFFVIDHQEKMAYQDIDPAVFGSYAGLLRAGVTAEFLHPLPYSDEINGRSRELKPSETIGTEDCYVINVVYQTERAPKATWYFSKNDFLPRARRDVYALPDGSEQVTRRTITNLVVDPKLDHGVFKLKLQAGYTKTEDFAP